MTHQVNLRRARGFIVITVVALIGSLLTTSNNVSANTLVLNWYSNYDYTDNQSLALNKRLIVTASSSTRGSGYSKWCVAVDGQPFAMTGTTSPSSVYQYFYNGVATRSVTTQTEVGCWSVPQSSLADVSDGFDITVPLRDLAVGLRTITLTGHHRTGSTASKSIVINKIAAPARTLSWYGSPIDIDNRTITGARRLIVEDIHAGGLVAGYEGINWGYTKWCVRVNDQPLIMRGATSSADGLTSVYSYFDRGVVTRSVTAQSEAGCWTISATDLVDSSEGFDVNINTASWENGQYTVVITGDHNSGAQSTKSVTMTTSNASRAPTVTGMSGTALSASSTVRVAYVRMNPSSQICLKRNGVAVDATFKLNGAPPNASGCWSGDFLAGSRTVDFVVDTLSWVDGSYTIEATVPHVYPEIGSASAAFTSVNPALGVSAAGVSDNEQVLGVKSLSVAAVIGAVHTSQIKPARYCIDLDGQSCTFTTTSNAASASYNFVSYAYPDGAHSLKFRTIDSAGREASRTVAFQIANGKPTVSNTGAKTTAPDGPKGKASATINFTASRATAATVFVRGGKGAASRVDVDMLSDTNESRSASFDGLQPSTKFTYEVVARNANGESKAVAGSFTTPAAPKPVPRASSSGSSGGSGSGSAVFLPALIGQRLDRVLSILGLSRSYAKQASSCRNYELFGIIRTSNWYVVGFSGGYVYACKP